MLLEEKILLSQIVDLKRKVFECRTNAKIGVIQISFRISWKIWVSVPILEDKALIKVITRNSELVLIYFDIFLMTSE